MKTLNDLGAKLMSVSDICELFPDAWWHEVFDNEDLPVHFIEGDCSIDSLTAGDGPWSLVVHGDLRATGTLDFATGDDTSLLVVLGSVRAKSFRFTHGVTCDIAHDLEVTDYVIAGPTHEGGGLVVGGTLRARAFLLDDDTGLNVKTIDAIVCASPMMKIPFEIDYAHGDHSGVFAADVLDDGRVDLELAWDAITRDEPLLLPEAEARLRALVTARNDDRALN